MVDAVDIGHVRIIAHADVGEVGDVDSELAWVAAPLMMRVDAADRAEIMARGAGAPSVEREPVLAAQYRQLADLHARHHRPPPRAEGAIAPPRLLERPAPGNLDRDRAAMAGADEARRIVINHLVDPRTHHPCSDHFFRG